MITGPGRIVLQTIGEQLCHGAQPFIPTGNDVNSGVLSAFGALSTFFRLPPFLLQNHETASLIFSGHFPRKIH